MGPGQGQRTGCGGDSGARTAQEGSRGQWRKRELEREVSDAPT